MSEPWTDGTRECRGCHEQRPAEMFKENPAMPSGRNVWCDSCQTPAAKIGAPRQPSVTSPREKRIDAPREKTGLLRPSRVAVRTSVRPPVLAINSYAGSLLIAARSRGLDVLGSYEDGGFGTKWQVENFPELKGLFASDRSTWPKEQDLDGAMVIAHPPCAAFSIQGQGSVKKSGGSFGVDSPHFKCTVDVMGYAMGNKCSALAIESVIGACEGGRAVHDEVAERHGYHVFRILQNSATFGLPQWRARFWAIFVRKDVASRMAIVHTPTVAPLFTVLDDVDPGPADPRREAFLAGQREMLVRQGFLKEDEWLESDLINEPGSLAHHIEVRLAEEGRAKQLVDVAKDHCYPEGRSKFISKTLRIMDPDGLAPVVLDDSWWLYKGRSVSPAEFRAIMGFPREYKLDHEYRKWLSKGVCPPVAAWVLEQMERVVSGKEEDLPDRVSRWIEPGEVCDLRPTQAVWDEMVGKPRKESTRPRVERERKEVAPRSEMERTTAVPGTRKRRVEIAYVLQSDKPITPSDLQQAFESRKDVVAPPLKEFAPVADGDWTKVRVVCQYEPPNAGGSRGDVEKILARGVRSLEAMGYQTSVSS